jgi:hypothetical protein
VIEISRGLVHFDASAVHPASVAEYHLGNNGTARKLLQGLAD